MIIGVTDESVELVDKWVAAHRPKYPIVILEDSTLEDALQVQYFPTAAVINPEGIITYTGSAGTYSSSLKDALRDATKGSVIPKAFKKFISELEKGNIGKAYDYVAERIESGKLEGTDLSWGRRLQKWLDSLAAETLTNAKKRAEEGWIYYAHSAVEPYRESKVGFAVSADLEAFVTKLEATVDFDKEMKGGEMFVGLQELADDWEYVQIIGKLKSIYKKYPDTQIGKIARAEAESIVEKGWPGMKQVCDNCRRKREACEKHAEKVKL